MKCVQAYKCESTGTIFERPTDAARLEFTAILRATVASLPTTFAPCSTSQFFEWMAGVLAAGMYPMAIEQLGAAVDYYRANLALLERGQS